MKPLNYRTPDIAHTASDVMQFSAPLAWIRSGFGDIRRAPALSLGIGAATAGLALAAQMISNTVPALTLPAVAVLMLSVPFLLTLLFSLAQQTHSGHAPGLTKMVADVRDNKLIIGLFALLLSFLFVAGVRVTAVVFALTVGPSVSVEFVQSLLPGAGTPSLVIATGAALVGALAVALTTFGLPIVHRYKVDAVTGVVRGIALMRRIGRPVLLWAALVLSVVSAAVWISPLILIVGMPLIGLANWHGYQSAAPQESYSWRA